SRPGRTRWARHPAGVTGFDVARTPPEASRARTARNGWLVVTWIAVSNPCLGAVVSGARCNRSGPASTDQDATSVAPFQLAYTVIWPPEARCAAAAGTPGAFPDHGYLRARYELTIGALPPPGRRTSSRTEPSAANSVYSGWSPHPAK